MKKTIALILALSGSSFAHAADKTADCIPWTFDDFDHNGEVIDGPVSQAIAEAEDASNSQTDRNGKPDI